ncbi:hypothetical protein M2T78_03535 [Elizabethkingia ursingii]|uniref:hypothetical protein n=1 Tax=Elizabethkingia ursingii TaxID=1756150 RepID=UPI002011C66A|nr:hypothetical protein [Elizabethkingia ursingii]MCL1663310.1 hypothetical protein [Elizabethkingia ursingii]
MIKFFERKISVEQIMEIEKNIIWQLKEHDKNFETVYMSGSSKIINSYFTFKPKGISIMRELLNRNAYNGLGKISNNWRLKGSHFIIKRIKYL